MCYNYHTLEGKKGDFMFHTAYLWLALGVCLTIVEVNTTALVCLWFIIGSAGAFLASLLTENLLLQVAVFAFVSAAALYATRPLVKKYTQRKVVATNADMLIGQLVSVTQDITPSQKGRVVAGGISYLASADTEIHTGAQVLVVSIAGNTLKVKTL